jgi:multidrug efflux pump subunit AcrA (membrane-fusion protein)
LPEVETTSVSKTVDLTDYSLLDSLQAQLSQAQADLAQAQAALAIAQAQNTADAQTIAALQAQVTSLQAQVAQLQSYINGLGLDKLAYFKILRSYSEVGGGIYVPPSYDDATVNYGDVFELQLKTLRTYSTTGGGYP